MREIGSSGLAKWTRGLHVSSQSTRPLINSRSWRWTSACERTSAECPLVALDASAITSAELRIGLSLERSDSGPKNIVDYFVQNPCGVDDRCAKARKLGVAVRVPPQDRCQLGFRLAKVVRHA